jgi:hypothetical protein
MNFDRETWRYIGVAAVTAGVVAVATKLGEWAVEGVRAAIKPPPRAEEKKGAA